MTEPCADYELPGMWEQADFMGGATDCELPAEGVLRDALVDAYDAIAHALNYRQEDHVYQHLVAAKTTIVDALHPENAGTPLDGKASSK